MLATALALFSSGLWLGRWATFHDHRGAWQIQDPQAAAGTWRIELQHPPCSSVHNLEVIWPKVEDGPLAIECNEMPVTAR